MRNLPLPDRTWDHLRLADWVELTALTSRDRNTSWQDLASALGAAGDEEDVEGLCNAVFEELGLRSDSAPQAYPFDVEGSRIQCKRSTWRRWTPYVFCLCLSYFGPRRGRTRGGPYPARLFEHLSEHAARHFVGPNGEAVRFASPRNWDPLPPGFAAALDKVCGDRYLHEGERDRSERVHSAKDAGLDIIAWRHFPDRRCGKLVLFGNCASGSDWQRKISERTPADFCSIWLAPEPRSAVLAAVFIPHRVRLDLWRSRTPLGGILFDRCRLAYWAQQGTWSRPDLQQQIHDWTTQALQQAGNLV